MTAIASMPDDLRLEAARIAFALIRFEEQVAPLGPPPASGVHAIGVDPYLFTPSLRRVAPAEVEAFLARLPSPALLSPTTTRGIIALTLVHELSGDRRRGAEKILSNATVIFDELSNTLGLTATSMILLKVNEESHLLSHAGTRLWTQLFAVQVGWNIGALEHDPRAQAVLRVRRSDGHWSEHQ